MHLAARTRNAELVRLLVRSGAEPDCSTSTGVTPLSNACSVNDVMSYQYLVSVGADPSHADRYCTSRRCSSQGLEVARMVQLAAIAHNRMRRGS